MVRHSHSHGAGLSSRDVGVDIGGDIPQARRRSPLRGEYDQVEKALSREESLSRRNCKIITAVWAVLTAVIILAAQASPGNNQLEPEGPLHWSADVLRANRRASYFLDHRSPSAAKCNVRDFGAAGDGVTLDTMALHKAIRACLGNNGEALVPAPGVYAVEYIRLPSQARLRVEAGAVLQAGADGEPPLSAVTYPFAPLISVRNASDVAITGGGTIRGRGGDHWLRRKFSAAQMPWVDKLRGSPMVEVFGSQRVLISGVILEDSTACSLKIHHSWMVVAEGLTVIDRVVERGHTGILIDTVQTVEVTDSSLRGGGAVAVGVMSSGEASVTRDVLVQNTAVYGGQGVGVMASPGKVSEVVFKGLLLDGRDPLSRNALKRYKSGGLLLQGGSSAPSSPSARPAIDKVLFEDVVGFNLTYGIDLLVDKGATPPFPRVQGVEFHNVTMDACQEYAVRVAAPPAAPVRHVVLQDLLFTTNARYGWDCTAELHGWARNVEPSIPDECALKPEGAR